MDRDSYEILLLEIRQEIKEAEKTLKKLACIDIYALKKMNRVKEIIQQELIAYRSGLEKNENLVKLMEG